MDITGPQLEAQYERAIAAWPWMHDVERDHDLPPFLLAAIASKETNMANIKGDYTQRSGEASARYHGFGVWQRDIDAWGIPAGWLDDVRAQAEWSAALLRSNIDRTGSLGAGVTAYNGSGAAARAYAVDVLDRLAYLTIHYPAPVASSPHKEIITMFGYSADGKGWLYPGPDGKPVHLPDEDEKQQMHRGGLPDFGALEKTHLVLMGDTK